MLQTGLPINISPIFIILLGVSGYPAVSIGWDGFVSKPISNKAYSIFSCFVFFNVFILNFSKLLVLVLVYSYWYTEVYGGIVYIASGFEWVVLVLITFSNPILLQFKLNRSLADL